MIELLCYTSALIGKGACSISEQEQHACAINLSQLEKPGGNSSEGGYARRKIWKLHSKGTKISFHLDCKEMVPNTLILHF